MHNSLEFIVCCLRKNYFMCINVLAACRSVYLVPKETGKCWIPRYCSYSYEAWLGTGNGFLEKQPVLMSPSPPRMPPPLFFSSPLSFLPPSFLFSCLPPFQHRVSCNAGLFQTYYIAETDLELLTLQPLPPKC